MTRDWEFWKRWLLVCCACNGSFERFLCFADCCKLVVSSSCAVGERVLQIPLLDELASFKRKISSKAKRWEVAITYCLNRSVILSSMSGIDKAFAIGARIALMCGFVAATLAMIIFFFMFNPSDLSSTFSHFELVTRSSIECCFSSSAAFSSSCCSSYVATSPSCNRFCSLSKNSRRRFVHSPTARMWRPMWSEKGFKVLRRSLRKLSHPHPQERCSG